MIRVARPIHIYSIQVRDQARAQAQTHRFNPKHPYTVCSTCATLANLTDFAVWMS